MNTYIISYITNSGVVVLNNTVDGASSTEAIQDIKGTEGIYMVLSCVKLKKQYKDI